MEVETRMVEMMIRMVEMKDELVVGMEMRVVGVITCMMIRMVKIMMIKAPILLLIYSHVAAATGGSHQEPLHIVT